MKFYIRIGLAGPNVFHLPAKGASSKGADVDSCPIVNHCSSNSAVSSLSYVSSEVSEWYWIDSTAQEDYRSLENRTPLANEYIG